MKPLFILLGAIGTVFAGCTSPNRTSQAPIKLEVIDSRMVIMEKISLDHRAEVPVLTGSVARRAETLDTTQTHLDVTFYDAAGHVLHGMTKHFEPRQIPSRYSWPNYATYRVSLDSIPEGTARIEVRAHEGPHTSQ